MAVGCEFAVVAAVHKENIAVDCGFAAVAAVHKENMAVDNDYVFALVAVVYKDTVVADHCILLVVAPVSRKLEICPVFALLCTLHFTESDLWITTCT